MQTTSAPQIVIIPNHEVRRERSKGNRYLVVMSDGMKLFRVDSPPDYKISLEPGAKLYELLAINKAKLLYIQQ